MRYVEGNNLAALVARRGHLEPRLAAHLISQVASAPGCGHLVPVGGKIVVPGAAAAPAGY